jgi:flagellar export protein FliJ
MSALDSLIRLHRWQLDERRRQLADLDQLLYKLRQEELKLDAEQRTEQQAAGASAEAAFGYGGYARGVVERRRKLAQSIVEVEEQIVQAREALAETYQEVKRYEITASNRLHQQRQKLDRQQQRMMDEIAVEGYRRRRAAQR